MFLIVISLQFHLKYLARVTFVHCRSSFIGYFVKKIKFYITHVKGNINSKHFYFIIFLLYGVQSWVPTFLHRIHGWEHTRIGDQYGLVALFAGSLGVVSGPVIEKYLTKLNVNAATIVVCIVTAIALTIIGPITFLSLSSSTVLIGIFITSFFITLPLALFATSLQNITPNQYRGVVSGLYVFTVNITGYGLGPMVVAFFTDKVFKNEMAIDLSMATIFLICGPISFLIFYFGTQGVLMIQDLLMLCITQSSFQRSFFVIASALMTNQSFLL